MEIRFPHNLDKSIESMTYLVDRVGPLEKVALMKLLYIADRDHFIARGYPITGSRLVAMDKGPVPSECLNVIDGELGDSELVFKYLHRDNNTLRIQTPTQYAVLEPSEIHTLDEVIANFGRMSTWDLVNHTHTFPEYVEVYVRGTSRTIPFENLLTHYGGKDAFRYGRPVLSEETQARMLSPFPIGVDADLQQYQGARVQPFDIYNATAALGNCEDMRPWLILEFSKDGFYNCVPFATHAYGNKECFKIEDDHDDFKHTGLTRTCHILYGTIYQIHKTKFGKPRGKLTGRLLEEFRFYANL